MAGGKLDSAKKQKADEFYTQLTDIEKELKNYKNHFKNKIIFCNCDDPEYSNFYYYFVSHFSELGLKKLITTHFEFDKASYMLEYEGGADVQGDKDTVIKRAIKIGKKTKLKQNFQQGDQGDLFEIEPVRSYSGDFRSPECIELLKQSDIVVTNPPFSLFREYVAQLIKYKKYFIIIGNKNAIAYKEIFKLIKENKIWVGNTPMGIDMLFDIPEHFIQSLLSNKKEGSSYKIVNGVVKGRSSAIWFTNLDHSKRHNNLILYKSFSPDDYPRFDNYNAINIDKTSEIPIDYEGVMGVPISFLDKYNPDQFEIVDGLNRYSILDAANTNNWARENRLHMTAINGVSKYFRVLIRHKKSVKRKTK